MSQVLTYFKEISRIPRPSKHEEAIRAYLEDFFLKQGLTPQTDSIGNLIVRIPPKRSSSSRLLLLQAHIDMVCVSEAGHVHDFFTDPLELIENDGWLQAKGTTLGADNGAGIALIMNVVNLDTHPEIIAVFTVDEEAGMSGVMEIDAQMIKDAQMILNLDNEDDDEICIGSAGGVGINVSLPLTRIPSTLPLYQFKISGMKGGHSGVEIDKNRSNALRIMLELLSSYGEKIEILSMEGGTAHNVIPSEAIAILGINDLEDFQLFCTSFLESIKSRFDAPNLDASFTPISDSPQVIFQALPLIKEILSLPDGIVSMSQSLPGAVETSINLGIIQTTQTQIELSFLARSSDSVKLEQLRQHIETSLRHLAGDFSFDRGYPGWQDEPDSFLVTTTKKALEEVLGKTPKIVSIHAGLECGALVGAIKQASGKKVNALSFGPTILGAHSPQEKLNLASLERIELALEKILQRLA